MFCRFCGAELPEDTIFCSKCGKRVQKEAASPGAEKKETLTQKKKLSTGAVLTGVVILAFLVAVLVFAIKGRKQEQGQQGNDAGNDPMQQSPVSVDEVRFDGNGERDTVVIAYTWTNLTDSEISAAESVAIHAYQNGIALESADPAADGDLRQRKGKPGTAVALEAAFYLDDRTTEVLVEVTPQSTGSGIVYFSKTYSCTMTDTEEPGVGEVTAGITMTDFVGVYSYDGSFESTDGMYVDFLYTLRIEAADDGVMISETWRGMDVFADGWAATGDLNGNILSFAVSSGDSAGAHFLTCIPAAEAADGVDTIYLDGDMDMPFTRTADDVSAPTVDDPASGANSPVPVEPEPVNRQTNGSRLYEITKPREASLTPDDFIGAWETEGGLVFTISGGNGEYSIDLSENEGLGLMGGWFTQEIYNIEGVFCGMSGFNDFNGFEVSYAYSTDYPLNTYLNVIFEAFDGTVINDYVALVQDFYN